MISGWIPVGTALSTKPFEGAIRRLASLAKPLQHCIAGLAQLTRHSQVFQLRQ